MLDSGGFWKEICGRAASAARPDKCISASILMSVPRGVSVRLGERLQLFDELKELFGRDMANDLPHRSLSL